MTITRVGRSQLGAACRSLLGVLTMPGDVLFWINTDDNFLVGDPLQDNYDKAQSVLEELGATVHNSTDWSGNIHDYKLILFPMPIGDPSWWSVIESGWTGRIHLLGEWNYYEWITSRDYINSKTPITGMSIGETHISGGPDAAPGTVETNDLTEGLEIFRYVVTNTVTGGTALSKTTDDSTDPDQIWIARNKVGTVDWVLSGDTNHMSDIHGYVLSDNQPFVENLFTVLS